MVSGLVAARVAQAQPSFIPPLPIRELRDLTRYRESLVREQTALANRLQKLSESGVHIKFLAKVRGLR